MAAKFPLDVVLRAIDHVSAPLRGIAGRIQSFGKTIGSFTGRLSALSERTGITNLANKVVGLGGAIKGVGGGIQTMTNRVAGLAAATGLGAAGITAMGKAYADATGFIGDTSEQTGISRERFQELGFYAQLTGSSAESVAGALQKMNLAIGKAKGGSKELKEMFSGLGIKLKNANGIFKSTDEIFDTMVDRISKIKDPTLQAKAAVTIFGKSATELLPMIRGGKVGLAEMSAEARRLGIVLSDDAVREGEQFGDTLDTLMMALKGVGNSIGTALVPQLNKLGTTLIETIVKYRPQIEAFATSFAENLPGNIEKVTGFLGELYDGMQPVIDSIGWLSDTFGGATVALTVFGLYIGGPLIVSLISLTGSLISVSVAMVGPLAAGLTTAKVGFLALGKAILATPVGWIIAAVAAIAASVYIIYDSWDEIAAWFTEKWDAVKAAFSDGIINGLLKTWQEFNPVTVMLDAFNGLIKYLTGWDIGAILKEKITNAVVAMANALPDWAKELLGIDGAIAVTANSVSQQGQAGAPGAPGQPGAAAAIGQRAATGGAATPIGQRAAAIGQQAAQAAKGAEERVLVTVDMKNAPQGTRVTTTGTPGTKFDTNLGFAQGSPQPQ